MRAKSEIALDERPIQGIWGVTVDHEGNEAFVYTVHLDPDPRKLWQADAIEAYDDMGVGDVMPWFRVLRRGQIVARVPGWAAGVSYGDPKPATRRP